MPEASQIWTPNPGPQTRFLELSCFEALYGGAAGGGKTDAILADALRYVGHGYGENYKALILRRTMPELKREIIPRSRSIYRAFRGEYNKSDCFWTFPTGETIWFGYCERDEHVERYQGTSWQYVGWDELTHFSEYQYKYLFSRVRSGGDVPCRIRSTTNPGGPGHEWVFQRFGRWLDPEHKAPARPGQTVYLNVEDGEEIVVDREHPKARGRVFIPASLKDNKYLANDGAYERSLQELDAVKRAQLLRGDWLAKPGAGKYFKREWFREPLTVPKDCKIWIRCWDLAGSTKKESDWTVGVLLGKAKDSTYCVAHIERFKGTPGEVRARVLATAQQDGRKVHVGLNQEPAQAGLDQLESYVRMLAGFHVISLRETGDKVLRAEGISSQVEHHQVSIVEGEWNQRFFDEVEEFPDGTWDDQVDALSGAFNRIKDMSVSDRKPKPLRTDLNRSMDGWLLLSATDSA